MTATVESLASIVADSADSPVDQTTTNLQTSADILDMIVFTIQIEPNFTVDDTVTITLYLLHSLDLVITIIFRGVRRGVSEVSGNPLYIPAKPSCMLMEESYIAYRCICKYVHRST